MYALLLKNYKWISFLLALVVLISACFYSDSTAQFRHSTVSLSSICLLSSIQKTPVKPNFFPSSQRPLSYLVSPAFVAKTRNPNKKLRSSVSDAVRKRRPATGEDAFFCASLEAGSSCLTGDTVKDVALGVADGVGGWAELGIDSADFSHSLCEEMASMAKSYINDELPVTKLSPDKLLAEAYYNVESAGQVLAGGSTACVGVATSDGKLTVANLGDSGFFIFRNGTVIYQSEIQTHAFNTPYQMAIIPKELKRQDEKRGVRHIMDYPEDADHSSFDLKHGDVVLFGTDGLLDNLSAQDCLVIVNDTMLKTGSWVNDQKTGLRPNERMTGALELSKNIVSKAFNVSRNPNWESPFSKEVERYYGGVYKGGKVDDITILVMMVQHQLD
ncbi:protein serine/threonine phosphatase 2C [Nadsonia fulvescens var. elongata DSM 6958]|uniref:Protein phosphatase n=1 Tax=Nadsonia fulvescens var. elongata DSM 6958 TaxID=857566 RepID=A0A1E3PG80_9ASCO|nr:protein serine/threonine phosphatase 2C [Nadsonia fulvescens var. elongata DSM 6958]